MLANYIWAPWCRLALWRLLHRICTKQPHRNSLQSHYRLINIPFSVHAAGYNCYVKCPQNWESITRQNRYLIKIFYICITLRCFTFLSWQVCLCWAYEVRRTWSIDTWGTPNQHWMVWRHQKVCTQNDHLKTNKQKNSILMWKISFHLQLFYIIHIYLMSLKWKTTVMGKWIFPTNYQNH